MLHKHTHTHANNERKNMLNRSAIEDAYPHADCGPDPMKGAKHQHMLSLEPKIWTGTNMKVMRGIAMRNN